MGLSKRQFLEQRVATLKSERRRFWEHEWDDIASQLIPYSIVWEFKGNSERNSGQRKNDHIINNTPIRALGTLRAGMMAGITSPVRPWFNLTVSDRALAKVHGVRAWLDQVKTLIGDVLLMSNWYDTLSNNCYPEVGSIGTSAMFCEEDASTGVHFTAMPPGTYWLDHDHKGNIDVCFRKLLWTVRQMVQEFGYTACSKLVRQHWDRGEFNVTFGIWHGVYPNEERQDGALGPKGMRWASCWWEETNPNEKQFLRESGYEDFPVLVGRWEHREGNVYGYGPGWEVRGDCKDLQHKELELTGMVDKTGKPPLLAKGELGSAASVLPGAMTRIAAGQDADVKPLVVIHPNSISVMKEEIRRIEERIEAGLYVHLFQATINDERLQRATATEIQARQQEVMLMLGPLLQSLNTGLLEPCIMRVYKILLRLGQIPQMPDEMLGAEVTVEFVSILHQAQQATGTAGLRALVEETVSMARVNPDVMDKLNVDVAFDEFSNMFGVPRAVTRPDEEVEQVRSARAAARKAQAEGEAAVAAAGAAKDLSATQPQKIQDLLANVSPTAAAQFSTQPGGPTQ